MEHRHLAHHIFRLGPRVAVSTPAPESIGIMDPIMNIAVPSRLVEPRADADTTSSTASSSTCLPNDDSAQCQKPVGQSAFTLPIILGVAIPVIGALVAFIILHRRGLRKQREEDADERHASMDFGLGEVPGRSKKGRDGSPATDLGEKEFRRPRQVSMDMTMDNSPYLLPPELQGSKESLHSLSRNLHQHEDPYRGVAFVTGDGASIRSIPKHGGHDGSSIYTGSSAAPSRLHDLGAELLGNAGSMARSSPPTAYLPPPRQNSLPQAHPSTVTPVPKPMIGSSMPYPAEPSQVHVSDTNAHQAILRKGLPTIPGPEQGFFAPPLGGTSDPGYAAPSNYSNTQQNNNQPQGASEFRMPFDIPEPAARAPEREVLNPPNPRTSPITSLPLAPRPPRQDSMPALQSTRQPFEYEDSHNNVQVTTASPPQAHAEIVHGQRYSMDVPPEQFAQAGLGAPSFDPRRLSMGFRPLPPGELTKVDDPEIRANRIRSFYKEYFDESKPLPQGQYYEDYDENYLGGETAYYNPQNNNFVMPYTQPVTRRAMTPPPGGQRYYGSPRNAHGSVGAMSMNGMRQPQMYPPGPYPQGPRAFSTASGGNRRQGPPRRPMPPPAPLNSLPTPGKLRDDSFALMSAIDFAPPQSYRDRAAGRSQSPLGERRPYEQRVPAFAPLQSAFEELPSVPSPHVLRNSGTFTGLDFAPPKRFKDTDNMSDTGSIRSNRSGVSAVQLGAIRKGAYRVSRIPGDVVFAKDDMASTLKPQWGMRAGS